MCEVVVSSPSVEAMLLQHQLHVCVSVAETEAVRHGGDLVAALRAVLASRLPDLVSEPSTVVSSAAAGEKQTVDGAETDRDGQKGRDLFPHSPRSTEFLRAKRPFARSSVALPDREPHAKRPASTSSVSASGQQPAEQPVAAERVGMASKMHRNVVKTGKGYKRFDEWLPRRPRLALAAVRAVARLDGLVEAPPKQLRHDAIGTMQYKLFASTIARELHASAEAKAVRSSGQVQEPAPLHSVLCCVTEAIGVVYAEAEVGLGRLVPGFVPGAAEQPPALVALHGSTDAAWRGTAARGSGLAMNAAGRSMVADAAERVAAKLLLHVSTH